ncbi:MAG: hypothetical protein ACFFDN_36220, partial [Candidatus Hodarchaeota archaeon]
LDTINVPSRDPRPVFLKRIENMIENFEELFIYGEKINIRKSKLTCKWTNYMIQKDLETDLLFYEKVGFGCSKLECNTIIEIIKLFTICKEKLLKIFNIDVLAPLPNWYRTFKKLFSLFLKGNLDKNYKGLSYKCRALGDLLLIIDTNKNETILTSNINDFKIIVEILDISLIIFNR